MKLLFSAVALLSFSTVVQAKVEIDQSNLVVVPNGSRLAGSTIFHQPSFAVGRFGQMQSVTAGKTGLLTRLDLQIYRPNNARTILPNSISLVDGEPGTTGEIVKVASFNFEPGSLPIADDVQAGGLLTIDVSSLGYKVVSGQKFSILFSIPPGDSGPMGPTMNGGVWAFGYTTPIDEFDVATTFIEYDRGFNTLLEGNGTRLVSGVDRGFRTYVDVAAVPEPASWGLMILGFAAAGTAARGRRWLNAVPAST